jgi:hypothetical protein
LLTRSFGGLRQIHLGAGITIEKNALSVGIRKYHEVYVKPREDAVRNVEPPMSDSSKPRNGGDDE